MVGLKGAPRSDWWGNYRVPKIQTQGPSRGPEVEAKQGSSGPKARGEEPLPPGDQDLEARRRNKKAVMGFFNEEYGNRMFLCFGL